MSLGDLQVLGHLELGSSEKGRRRFVAKFGLDQVDLKLNYAAAAGGHARQSNRVWETSVMKALLRRWPKRQGRMILQAIYGDEPPQAPKAAPADLSVAWRESEEVPSPVYAESDAVIAPPVAVVDAGLPASHA